MDLGPGFEHPVPVCALYPYEIWLAPMRPVASLADLRPMERADLARAL